MNKSRLEKFLAPFQGFALLSLLLTPLLVQYDLEKNFQKVVSAVALDPSLQDDEMRPYTITSRVIKVSENALRNHEQVYSVETKQFRFEVQIKKFLRKPTSQGNEIVLEKKDKSGNWENIEILSSGEEGVYSSIFIEADEGSNEFRVTLKNEKNKIFPLSVKYLRKNI